MRLYELKRKRKKGYSNIPKQAFFSRMIVQVNFENDIKKHLCTKFEITPKFLNNFEKDINFKHSACLATSTSERKQKGFAPEALV